jgi:predicted secreted Zn-dependent protease
MNASQTEAIAHGINFGSNLGANKRKAKRLANRTVQRSRRLQSRIGYDSDTARNCERILRLMRYRPAAMYRAGGAA